MLQVILFALILGVILAKMGDRVETVKNFFSQFNDIMMEMTMIVMKVAPIGVFCLIAKTFSQLGIEAFQPLLKYMIAVLIALGIQCFIVYQALLKVFTGLNPLLFIKKFFPVMEFAFSMGLCPYQNTFDGKIRSVQDLRSLGTLQRRYVHSW